MEVRQGDGGVIAVEVAGEPDGTPVVRCHGLADSPLSARLYAEAARDLGLRLVAVARFSPQLFLRITETELPGFDRRAIGQPGMRDAFTASYIEAFRHGDGGVAQDHPGHGHFSIAGAAREILGPLAA